MEYPKKRVYQHIMEDRSLRIVRDLLPDHSLDLAEARAHVLHHISHIRSRLANPSRIYEELVREWFLPTHLSVTALTEF